MVASLLKMAALDRVVPDYTTPCRRQKTLAVQIPYQRADGPLALLVDRTGIKFLGNGEWQARKHGVQGRRQWHKVHLAMDTATSDIRTVEFIPKVMLFDEATSALDPELVGEVNRTMKQLAEERMTMIIVTHELKFAADTAEHVVFMADGRIVEEGPPEQVLRNPVQQRTRTFLQQDATA